MKARRDSRDRIPHSSPSLREMFITIAALLIAFAAHAHAAPEGYVPPETCRPCHAATYDEYLETPMGRSFYLPAAAPLIEDWQANNRLYHTPSDRHYEMTRRAGRLYIRRYQIDALDRRVNEIEREVTHIMGSGERARSYIHRSTDGRMIELPVSWYSQENAWAMSPGYDRPNHAGFTRLINHKCMFCHSGYPDVPEAFSRQGWDDDVHFPEKLPLGIDCQRCHGPGAAHVKAAGEAKSAEQIRGAIVNPARLSPERQLEVCMQCHLETTTFRLPDSHRAFGSGFYTYIPGQPLGEYIVHFDHAPGSGREDKFEIVSAAYRLRQSPCFLESKGRLTCTTCHDPHTRPGAASRPAHYRAKCLECHPQSATASAHAVSAPAFETADCVVCHMPSRRTDDVVHVVMTDHRIQRRKPARDLLSPLREKTDAQQTYRGEVVLYYPPSGLDAPLRDIFLGIAQVKEKANLDRGLPLLRKALSRREVSAAEPYFELGEAEASAGNKQAAIRAYRQAIERDPAAPQPLNNLANLLADLGRMDEAIETYRKAIRLDPVSSKAHTNLGLALLEKGDIANTERAFRDAVKANPMDSEAQLNLGSAFLMKGNLDDARQALLASLAIEPSKAKAHFNLGLLFRSLGQNAEARIHFESAMKYGDSELRMSAAKYLDAAKD